MSKVTASRPSAGWMRLGIGGLLLLVYALPLFYPPATGDQVSAAHGGFLERLFPGVPPLWIACRLLALVVGAVALSGGQVWAAARPLLPIARVEINADPWRLRFIALIVAVLQLLAAPFASQLGALGQYAYIFMLFVPVLLLSRQFSRPNLSDCYRAWGGSAVTLTVLVWVAWCLFWDVSSPRVLDNVDGWRGWVDIEVFFEQGKNILSDRPDPLMSMFSGTWLPLLGWPLFQSGLLPFEFRWVQVVQIVVCAITALGVGVLAGQLVGRRASVVAVAFFLFAPCTRFVSMFPGPFLAGPAYGTAAALCAVFACRHRSEAALAAFGAIAGLATGFPGTVPFVAFLGLTMAWYLRADWRNLWIGGVVAAVSFAAVIVPAVGNVYTLDAIGSHFDVDGAAAMIELGLLGQLPVSALRPEHGIAVWRPLDIIVAALLVPFANPRTSIRYWGDVVFDPLSTVLLAIGVVVCLRSLVRSPRALWFLLLGGAALCLTFTSPVDRVDLVHSPGVTIPAALIAAVGFVVLRRQVRVAQWRRWMPAIVAGLSGLGGLLLFDFVNPRILAASSMGIMFRALRPHDAARVMVLDYARDWGEDVEYLFIAARATYGGVRPVAFREYSGGPIPAEALAEQKKDILFWSPGFEREYRIAGAVCSRWPGATLYEIWDQAHRSRVYAARIGGEDWGPRLPNERWRSDSCRSDLASPEAPGVSDPSPPGRG